MEAPLNRLRTILPGVALDPGTWPSVLRELEEYIGCSDLHLITVDPRTQEIKRNLPLNARDAAEDFLSISAVCEPLKYATQYPRWRVVKDQDFISEEEICRSEFYDWAAKYNATYRLGLRLLDKPDLDAHLWFLKEKSQGPVNEDDVRKLQLVRWELTLAAATGYELSGQVVQGERLVESFEAIDRAALLVDQRGNVSSVNQLARDLVRESDGVQLCQGALVFSALKAQAAFDHLLNSLITPALKNEVVGRGGKLLIERPSGLPPYVLIVSPLPESDHFLSNSEAKAIVVISDPSETNVESICNLASAFSLTPAEIAVARLFAEGSSVRQIAETQSVSVHTVRSQIKSVMHKT